MIQITDTITLEDHEIEWDFMRATGPGGQHVNKTASAVQLRFDAANSPALSGEVKNRLKQLAGKRMTTAGILIITARRYRRQERNREDAVERLAALVRQATQQPKARRPTRPTASGRKRRLQAKRKRSQIKQMRRTRDDE